ncbi:MAG: hypothetical protein A2X78_02220 [Gammaproteobacteria bacterium GWE2_37_16]|nr:MAG: hypothetical protein A2X78_02220 [Gammaproteobacteria bacterium GWE2_37_16]
MLKKTRLITIVVICSALMFLAIGSHAIQNVQGWMTNPTAKATQMLLVTAKDWTSTVGTLQRFERATPSKSWNKVGDKIDVNLGENGMGWGVGLHGTSLTPGPRVLEGSKMTPVGVFAITQAFGKESGVELGVKLAYKQITETVFCPDDMKSKFYNSLVDTKDTQKDWNSAEDMSEYMNAGFYTYGLIVNHNYDKPIAGRGSCFFLHASLGAVPTAGCTSFTPNLVKEVIIWLDPQKNPVLVQLTESVYAQFKGRWQLPKIEVSAPLLTVSKNGSVKVGGSVAKLN